MTLTIIHDVTRGLRPVAYWRCGDYEWAAFYSEDTFAAEREVAELAFARALC